MKGQTHGQTERQTDRNPHKLLTDGRAEDVSESMTSSWYDVMPAMDRLNGDEVTS